MRGRPANTFSWTAIERRQLDTVRSRVINLRHNAHALRLIGERAQISIRTLTRLADGYMPQRLTLVKLVDALQL